LRLIPVDLRLAGYNPFLHLIYLDSPCSRLNIWEHIGVLKLLGLNGVVVEGSAWPPYHGRPFEIWEALKPHVVETNSDIHWLRPEKRFEWHYPNGRQGFLRIEPHDDPEKKSLEIHAILDYKTLGETAIDFSFPGNGCVEKMFQAKSPGWPRWRYHLCCLASGLGWPHLNSVTWPQRLSPELALEQFALHRIGDCGGAMSLAHFETLPSAKVTSYCAGHEADLATLSQVQWIHCGK